MDNNTFDSELCVVCREVTDLLYFFNPCRHQCICQTCALNYKSQENRAFDTCPICRTEFVSIEFDESNITDDSQNAVAIEEARKKQLVADLDEIVKQMLLAVSDLDELSQHNRNEEYVEAATHDQLPPIARERLRSRSHGNLLQGRNIAGPSRSQDTESDDGERNEGRMDGAERSEFILGGESALRTSASTGAIPRTYSPFMIDIDSNRTTQIWEEGYEWADPSTPTTSTWALRLPITVIQREIMNTVFLTAESTLVGKSTVRGKISINYPINLYFILNANLNLQRINFTLKYWERLCKNDDSAKDVCDCVSNEHGLYFTIPVDKLKELIPKQAKKESNFSDLLTTTVLSYTTRSSTLHDDEHLCPLILKANWDVQKFTTDLIIRYKYTSMARQAALHDVQVTAYMSAGFDDDFESKPAARREGNKLVWKLPNPESQGNASADNDDDGYYKLRATFKFHLAPSAIRNLVWRLKANRKGKISAQFMGTGSTLSGCDFHLLDTSYTIKGVKKHFQSGKYMYL